MPKSFYAISITMAALSIAAILWALGQPLICACGYIKLWDGNVYSSGNSQHIADWYSLSHILHGILIVLIARLFFPNLSFFTVFSITLATGFAWEVMEHSNWVMERFRAGTINQGYFGDSILNAVSDFLWMWLGLFIAYFLRLWQTIVLVIILEFSAGFYARDNLTLSIVMVVYPIESIKTWQLETRNNLALKSVLWFTFLMEVFS